MTRDIRFPKGFLWGASTSAFQVEGSPLADGAGPSIWYRFTHTPGLVADGDTGDVASDHYRCWEEDIRLMRDLGLNAYRFGIAWHRILPEGTGRVNAKGLDFYRALVDGLLENNIQPMITLFHWDLPAALEDRGGWLNRDIANWFAEYAQVCYRALDDRVDLWTTLNEPWVVSDGGYLHGALAPGHRNLFEAPIASHNLLRAHASAVEAYRAEGQHQIGVVINVEPKYPASDKPEDLEATARADAYMNRQYLDALFLGAYPAEMKEIFGEAWPDFPAEDLEHIRRPFDFLGINYYTRRVTCHDPNAKPVQAGGVKQRQATHTETDWEVYPEGLADTLLGVKQRYGDIPLYVTENGAAFYDPPSAEGEVNDPLRVEYFREHLKVIRRMIQEGVNLRGYFAWSLLDNFEWSLGYSKRFGIIHVDYATQRRTPKASARFYAEVIKSRGSVLGALD
ncbi:MAG: GH1 family beta-glucosidase [Acidobacteriota bacterium]